MIADRNTIKSWFQRGMKPLATQFAAWIDSFWHKTDTIPTANIEGLEDTLNKKAEQMDVNNLYADFVRHRADEAKHKTEAEQGKLNNLAANPNATYATRAELEQISSNSIIIIPADFTKGSADMEAEIIATVQERLTDGTLFSKPVYLLYKWKKDYTSEDAPVYYALVSKSDEKRTEGSVYTTIQMYFNSSIVVTEADAPEYPAAYCIMLNIRGEQVRVAYQKYEDQHPVYALNLTEDGNGIINNADKNWDKLYTELTKGKHPQVALKTPDSGIYCPATYDFTSIDESLSSPIYAGKLEISYLKEQDGIRELWVETRVFSDLSASSGTYTTENYLKKYTLTGSGELTDTHNCIVTFPDQDSRTNIASGESHSVLFGKIKRWFADLKAVAFTGRAADLTQDADNRLVTDAEKAGWADKYTRAEVDNKDADGLQAAKEYAAQKVAEIVGSAPETLDTLNELADALGNDPNFATSIMALIGGKADLVHVHTKAQITDFPAALPANGGDADTVGGFNIDNLGKVINAPVADLDNTPGFFSSYWTLSSAGTKPADYGTVVQIVNKYGRPNDGEQVWVFQIAHAHGIDRPMWRRQTNNGGWTEWKRVAFMDDIPASLPANGGNADTVDDKHSSDLFVSGVLSLNHSDLNTFVNRISGTYRVYDGDSAMCLIVFRNPAASASGVEMYVGYNEDDHIQVRKTVDSNRYTAWKSLAYTTDIPTSLPANGGNADTVGGYFPSYLMKRNSGTEIQADAILGTSQYGFGYENRGFPTSGSFISFGGFSDDYTTQIIAEYKGNKMYFRTYDGDLKKWNNWQRLARYDEVLRNSGEQTLSDGRLNMLVSAPEHVVMFKDAAGNIGYIGFGAYPTKDLQIMNYATGKFISIAADGKLYYDNKELAFKDDIAGTTLMLDTRDTPEAIQNNIAVFKATFTLLSTRVDIPRIGISLSEELGYSTGHRLWAIGAAQMEGVAIKFTFCGLDSSDMIQYMKVIVTSAGLLTITPVPH